MYLDIFGRGNYYELYDKTIVISSNNYDQTIVQSFWQAYLWFQYMHKIDDDTGGLRGDLQFIFQFQFLLSDYMKILRPFVICQVFPCIITDSKFNWQ